MSRPLLKDSAAKELIKIQKQLEAESKGSGKKFIRLPVEDAEQLSGLIADILKLQPIVFEEDYLTPNEASEFAGVSRPMIVEMLKAKTLVGHQVGTHWRVKKQSLIDYMNRRDKAQQAVTAMDEDGFGLD